MGKAARWLWGLLGGKKQAAAPPGDAAAPPKEKRRWGFARSFRDKEQQQQRRGDGRALSAAAEAASSTGGPRSYASSAVSSHAAFAPSRRTSEAPALDEDEQSKRAIAVAAATAAVAEAAVAAAQAAAAVVRLTSSGRCPGLYTAAGRKADEWAAVKIQAAFRGYLARRALRALRGLVKLQALVRGHIVRKETAEAMRCMQALVRVQARARACRALSENGQSRRASRQTHPGPPTPEKFEPTIRSNSVKHERGSNLKRNDNAEHLHPDRIQTSYNWLERWMEERYWDISREVSSRTGGATDDERDDKILEVDTGKPHLNPRRWAAQHSSSSLASAQNSHSFATVQNSPSNYSTTAQLSIPSPSSVDMEQHSLSPLRFVVGDGETCNSPQLYSATSRPGSARRGPFTPTKSECSRSFFSGYADYPNYMANTESSRAKVRSHSAPRQRPEYEKPTSVNWIPAAGPASGGGGQSSSSSSQRSVSQHLKFAGKAYPGSGRLDRLGMPVRY